MNDLETLLLLNMVPSLGCISILRLIQAFDSPRKILDADRQKLLRIEGITVRKIDEIYKAKGNADKLDREIKLCRDKGIKISTVLDKDYPENLKNIYDPPVVLYIKGDILDCDYNSIAVVGSRRASFYGISTASRLSVELAQSGITIVSGLARGIDTASHKGALAAKGRTIAVLGSGILKLYPPENKELAGAVSENGAIVSEFSLETPPLARNFPRRNRIISGLSLGVVVVEAARNSGALITADLALEHNREVFAVPGKMDSTTSIGTHSLIKQGAKLISCSEDIIDEVKIKLKGFSAPKRQECAAKEYNNDNVGGLRLDSNEDSVYKILSREPLYIDDIINLTNMNIAQLSPALVKLQLKNMIKELPGKNFVRAQNG
ncbi:MAG: DNA-processing protein DprA [Candidatus Omnitrophica bacterium]|nr:DNA-processing protein DprA [Candidatus Omnitrophota bacterium]MDD5355626.1 DNA-processing protein DprA [Candidatus Omnitrophota bacterium]